MDDSAAAVNHRPTGIEQQSHSFRDLLGVAPFYRGIGADLDALGVTVRRLCSSDILGYIDNHRTRASRPGQIERFLDS